MKNSILFVVLAAGKGTRMKSSLSKVLHKVCDKPLVEIVVLKVLKFIAQFNQKLQDSQNYKSTIVVVCSDENELQIKTILQNLLQKLLQNASDIKIVTVVQKQRLGTGDAVKTALLTKDVSENNFEKICILYGDSPLFELSTIEKIINSKSSITFAGFNEQNTGLQYGRMFVESDKLLDIIEFKDASEQQKNITFFNSGLVGGSYEAFKNAVFKIQNKNTQGEYYLTDIAKICWQSGFTCGFITCDKTESIGVNNMKELTIVDSLLQAKIRDEMMQNGVRLMQPESIYFSFDTKISSDVVIEPNVIFKGKVDIKSGVVIKAFSYIEDATIGENSSIGPFARFRGSVQIASNCKIGNFVEIKASKLQNGVKAAHLTYIGDAEIDENTNIGAGAVFCNYDGVNKHKTKIGKNAFIGSNTSLIAPLTLPDDVLIAAGSVITKKASLQNGDLFIERSPAKILKKPKN